MLNADIQAGWNYHNATKHSQSSIRANPHFLDWANQPLQFKIYPKLDLIPLPRELREIGITALGTIAQVAQRDNALPDLQTSGELLYFSAGVTRRRTFPGGEIYFRAAACTGALYEIELYLACGRLPDLEAGLYHLRGSVVMQESRSCSGAVQPIDFQANTKTPFSSITYLVFMPSLSKRRGSTLLHFTTRYKEQRVWRLPEGVPIPS